MFVLKYVNYDHGREDRVQWDMIFEDRDDAQHKADADNEGLRNHLRAMALMSASVNGGALAPEVDETTQDWTYVEEWEFVPSTKPKVVYSSADGKSIACRHCGVEVQFEDGWWVDTEIGTYNCFPDSDSPHRAAPTEPDDEGLVYDPNNGEYSIYTKTVFPFQAENPGKADAGLDASPWQSQPKSGALT